MRHLFGYNQICVSLENLSYQLKFPTQVRNNVTGYVPLFVDVILFDVKFDAKFDVNVFDVKILSMLSFWYYPIQS